MLLEPDPGNIRLFVCVCVCVCSFPVESMVIDPATKTVTHRVNANELMDDGTEENQLLSGVKL